MVRRWWLVALAVGSLVVLLYASIATALSVPVTAEMDEANRLPGEPPLRGARALLVPIPDPTRAQNQILVGGDSPTGFPSGAPNATMGRILAYVAPTANGSYVPARMTFPDVPYAENGTVQRTNLTVDVTALAGGRTGYLIKGDAEREARFVDAEAALGTVGRYETPASLLAMFSFGSVGFLAPLLALILTQRKSGRPGVPGSPADLTGCPECRRPVDAKLDFCTSCGAWLPKRT